MKKHHNGAGAIRSKILDLLKRSRQHSLTLKQIMAGLDMNKNEGSIINGELKKMAGEGLVIRTEGNRYGLPERLGILSGVLQGNRRGFAFLRPEQKRDDVYISAQNLNEAAHGDRVLVKLDRKKNRRKREGTVIGILKRGQSRLVGTLRREGKRYYVFPDDQRFPGPVQVPLKGMTQAQVGDKVVVEIERWAQGNKPARGKLVEYIGPVGTRYTEQMTFKHRFELPGEHPPQALKELESLPGEKEISRLAAEQKRADLTDLQMVTIDDELARDFDDAVSLEQAAGGVYRLGVHIADVSQYVRQGKALDREALKRGTTIYLVERAIHMLPPQLSENICSLQAGKDRLAVSVIMDIDGEGNLIEAAFKPSLIRVDERLSYQQVEAYLSGREEASVFKGRTVADMIDRMADLAEVLRTRRMQRGSLDLDIPEARIEVDEEGAPLKVEKRVMGQSESLIEEFMIYCNETVASYLEEKNLPCLYRIHAVPAEEKLVALRETLGLMNIKAAAKMKVLKPGDLKTLLEETKGEQTEKLVRYLVLRSLPQALYSAFNEGHFGLASERYCHFTSPIRRYPDLVVHRILKQHLLPGGYSKEKAKRLQARLPGIAQQSSERERAAVEAERASVEMKKAHYMEQKLGEEYTGIINGVTNFGLFVELENTVEGMIPVNELKDDYYIYNEKAALLTGERTRKSYRLGDSVQVKVIRANREEGKVTFAPAEEEAG